LWAAKAAWHSLGVYGALVPDLPVGTPLIRSLDHLVLVLAVGVEEGGSWSVRATSLDMLVAFCCRKWRGVLGPAVSTKLPLAVHLAATSCIGAQPVIFEISELSILQMTSGRCRMPSGIAPFKLITRLWLGVLVTEVTGGLFAGGVGFF